MATILVGLTWVLMPVVASAGTNTWTYVTPLQMARAYPGAATGPCQGSASATCLYAIGGRGVSTNALSSVEMYDPSTDTWSYVAPLQTARWNSAASGPCQGSVGSTCLYAIGGYNGSSVALSSVEMYDPSTNTWSYIAPLQPETVVLFRVSVPESIMPPASVVPLPLPLVTVRPTSVTVAGARIVSTGPDLPPSTWVAGAPAPMSVRFLLMGIPPA